MTKFPTRRNREFISAQQGIKSGHQGNYPPDQGTPPFHPTTAVSQECPSSCAAGGRASGSEGLLDARASVVVTPDVTVAPMGSSVTWKAAASRVPRPKARLADSRRAGCAGRAAPCRNDLVFDRLGLKVKEAQELTRFRVQCDPRTFAEKAKRTPSDACATGIRRPAARRFGICPGVLCRVHVPKIA